MNGSIIVKSIKFLMYFSLTFPFPQKLYISRWNSLLSLNKFDLASPIARSCYSYTPMSPQQQFFSGLLYSSVMFTKIFKWRSAVRVFRALYPKWESWWVVMWWLPCLIEYWTHHIWTFGWPSGWTSILSTSIRLQQH